MEPDKEGVKLPTVDLDRLKGSKEKEKLIWNDEHRCCADFLYKKGGGSSSLGRRNWNKRLFRIRLELDNNDQENEARKAKGLPPLPPDNYKLQYFKDFKGIEKDDPKGQLSLEVCLLLSRPNSVAGSGRAQCGGLVARRVACLARARRAPLARALLSSLLQRARDRAASHHTPQIAGGVTRPSNGLSSDRPSHRHSRVLIVALRAHDR
jgi:hypothetical protein